jgi:DNA-binding NarL/FixJ family response regulator
MLAGADVNRFILGLTTKQQIILRLRVSGEEIKYIARYLGTSTKSVQRELAGIKKAWKSYK